MKKLVPLIIFKIECNLLLQLENVNYNIFKREWVKPEYKTKVNKYGLMDINFSILSYSSTLYLHKYYSICKHKLFLLPNSRIHKTWLILILSFKFESTLYVHWQINNIVLKLITTFFINIRRINRALSACFQILIC